MRTLLLILPCLVFSSPARAADSAEVSLRADATGAELLGALRSWLKAHGGRDRCSLLVGDGFSGVPLVTIAVGDRRVSLPYACGILPHPLAGHLPYIEETWIDPPRPTIRVRYLGGFGEITEGTTTLARVPSSARELLDRIDHLRRSTQSGPVVVDLFLRVLPPEDAYFPPSADEYKRVMATAHPLGCFGATPPAGAVTFEVKVDQNGKPTNVVVDASSVPDEKALTCLTGVMRGLAFRATGDSQNLSVPLLFSR